LSVYIDVIYCTYCTTPILLISAHTTYSNTLSRRPYDKLILWTFP